MSSGDVSDNNQDLILDYTKQPSTQYPSSKSSKCDFCGIDCANFSECNKRHMFNMIIENAEAMARLKKSIKCTTPTFKGKTQWFTQDISDRFIKMQFGPGTQWQYRFLTVTFDYRRFTLDQLTKPQELLNYFQNVIYDLRDLFSRNPIIILEYHKNGVPHFHLNYECEDPMKLTTLILRLRYYFQKDLRNNRPIHDRIFNEGGQTYMQKANTTYFQFKLWEKPLEKSIEKSLEILGI